MHISKINILMFIFYMFHSSTY